MRARVDHVVEEIRSLVQLPSAVTFDGQQVSKDTAVIPTGNIHHRTSVYLDVGRVYYHLHPNEKFLPIVLERPYVCSTYFHPLSQVADLITGAVLRQYPDLVLAF